MGEIKKDCFALERKKDKDGNIHLGCSALSEMLCVSKDKCSFYMSRSDKAARDSKLREKGYNV